MDRHRRPIGQQSIETSRTILNSNFAYAPKEVDSPIERTFMEKYFKEEKKAFREIVRNGRYFAAESTAVR